MRASQGPAVPLLSLRADGFNKLLIFVKVFFRCLSGGGNKLSPFRERWRPI